MTDSITEKEASAFFAGWGARRISYNPDLAKLIGIKETVFFMQLYYWHGKGSLPDGWIWKTQADMEDETGLSRTEQETARRNLKKYGLLEDKLAQIPARLHYRIDLLAAYKLIQENVPVRRKGRQDSGKAANRESGSEDQASKFAETPPSITEITPENTPLGITLPTGEVAEQPPPYDDTTEYQGTWSPPVKAKTKRKKPRARAARPRTEHQRFFSRLAAAYRIPAEMTDGQRGRLNSMAKRVREGGFDLSHISNAEREWWKGWPGTTGSPPNDGQFLQRLEIVRRRQADHDKQWT